MKRIVITVISSVVIYGCLLWICTATGSSIFSSGPLDWLYDALIMPGLHLAELLKVQSELAIVTICWLIGTLIIAAITYGLNSVKTMIGGIRTARGRNA